MNLIFLDIDGVLISVNDRINIVKSGGKTAPEIIQFDSEKMHRLNRIVNSTNSLIILTSTWRMFSKDSECYINLINNFNRFGLSIYDHTPIHPDRTRGIEICMYLDQYIIDNNMINYPNYIVIDDDTYDIKDYVENVVKIDGFIGLDEESTIECITLLKGE